MPGAASNRTSPGSLPPRREHEGRADREARIIQELERAGLSREAISALERGSRRLPCRATVSLLVEALGLDAANRDALERAVARAGLARLLDWDGRRADDFLVGRLFCDLGVLAMAEGAIERGVRLIAAGAHVNRVVASVNYPDVLRDVEASLARARKTLGDDRFAAAWSEGQTMTLEQAVAHALDSGVDA